LTLLGAKSVGTKAVRLALERGRDVVRRQRQFCPSCSRRLAHMALSLGAVAARDGAVELRGAAGGDCNVDGAKRKSEAAPAVTKDASIPSRGGQLPLADWLGDDERPLWLAPPSIDVPEAEVPRSYFDAVLKEWWWPSKPR
jgi:hypothetical protein